MKPAQSIPCNFTLKGYRKLTNKKPDATMTYQLPKWVPEDRPANDPGRNWSAVFTGATSLDSAFGFKGMRKVVFGVVRTDGKKGGLVAYVDDVRFRTVEVLTS